MRAHRSGGIPALATLALIAACHSNQELAVERAPAADSIVLERTLCYGSCPAYRLSIRGDGLVRFVSRNPDDTTGMKTDSIAPAQVAWLVQEAERLGFFALPPVIENDSTLCPLRATDHPGATVTISRADSTYRVVDYLGCYSDHDLAVNQRVRQLRGLEIEIDSIAHSSRWVKPATR
jgi:hypothetical protein